MSKQTFDHAVFIGRFQPFHNAHLAVCIDALTRAENLVILIGSSTSSRNLRNPFTFNERKKIITDNLNALNYQGRYTILGIRDYYYSDNMWVANVQQLVSSCIGPEDKVALVGFNKDESSYYLKLFPKFKFIELGKSKGVLNATEIRDIYFEDSHHEAPFQLGNMIPESTLEFLDKFIDNPVYPELVKEHKAISEYKQMYRDAQRKFGIYPPTFVTVDAVVTCGGHVLMVKRKGYPGKGLMALPGGFIKEKEKLKDACIRELREETRIKVPPAVMRGSIVDSKVFDHPDRSTRGRTITHAYHIQLNEKELPKVKGGDDAAKAFWVPLNKIIDQQSQCFEDHFYIIEYFINRG